MKQIQKTPEITQMLHQRVGADLNIDSVSVFEAIALNTLPLRKRSTLYKDAVVDHGLLYEMAAAVKAESLPVQIMHDKEPLPIGRVFHGEVVGQELRVLFFLNNNETDAIAKIETGTVDQVSVSILPKHLYNSVSGFDYLGPEATSENHWTGADNEGNVIGENGVHARLVGLDAWFELSLVGQGGAQNARIVHRDSSVFGSSYQKLAASGIDPNHLVLVAAIRNESMDLKELVDQLTNTKVQLNQKETEVASLTASNEALTAQVAELTAKLEAANAEPEKVKQDLADAQSQLSASQADASAAVASLKEVAKSVLTAAGKPDAAIPETVTELTQVISDAKSGLAAVLVVGGRSQDSVSDVAKTVPLNLGAYRTGRK
jgi:hypothetical protein